MCGEGSEVGLRLGQGGCEPFAFDTLLGTHPRLGIERLGERSLGCTHLGRSAREGISRSNTQRSLSGGKFLGGHRHRVLALSLLALVAGLELGKRQRRLVALAEHLGCLLGLAEAEGLALRCKLGLGCAKLGLGCGEGGLVGMGWRHDDGGGNGFRA